MLAVIHLFEGAIEGRRFTGAGRAGDEDDAIRFADHAVEGLARRAFKAEAFQRRQFLALAQETQDQRFAPGARQAGDAKVDIFAGKADRLAAILRQAALGNVHAGDQLDARGDGVEAAARLGLDPA